MCYVVRKSDNMVLNRIDAWELDSVGTMRRWAQDNGFSVIDEEITVFGNMIIWVE